MLHLKLIYEIENTKTKWNFFREEKTSIIWKNFHGDVISGKKGCDLPDYLTQLLIKFNSLTLRDTFTCSQNINIPFFAFSGFFLLNDT